MSVFKQYSRIEVLLAIGSGLLIYLLGTRSFTGDGLEYAAKITSGEGMWHPHHLIFIPVNHWLMQFFHALGWEANAFQVAQIHNAILAGLGVGAFYRIQERIWKGDWMRWVFLAALLFSFGYWTYSTQVEVYICSLSFLLLLVRGGKTGWRIFYLAMAILYHQANVLFVIPLLLQAGFFGARKDLFRSLGVVGGAGLLVILAYVVGMGQQGIPVSLDGFFSYSLSYQLAGHSGWGTWDNVSFIGLRDLFNSQVEGMVVPWTPGLKWLTWPFGLLIVGILGGWLMKGRKRSDSGSLRSLGWLAFFWVVLYLAFFWWWLPSEGEFSVLVIPGLLILSSLLVSSLVGRLTWLRWVVAVPVVLVLLLNLRTFLKARFEPDHTRIKAEWIAENAGECSVFADYHLATHLRHAGWENITGMEGMMNGYYGGENLKNEQIPESGCFFIGLEFLDPGFTAAGHDGYTDRGPWQAFLYDVFGVRPTLGAMVEGPEGAPDFVYNRYEVVSFEGNVFFRVLEDAVPFEGERALLLGLDEEMMRVVPEQGAVFGPWLQKAD